MRRAGVGRRGKSQGEAGAKEGAPMSDVRVLLVGGKDSLPAELQSHLGRDPSQPLLAETTSVVQEAMTRLSEKGFDAVVCWAERQDELAGVIRIRKENPELPIVLLTSREEPAFEELSRQSGATQVVRNARDVAVLAEHLRLAIQSGELRKQLRALTQRSQAKDVRILAKDTLDLARMAVTENRKKPGMSFVPLIVEDDPDQALFMTRALQKADIFAPLPILKTGEEAIAYFSGTPPFEKRDRLHEPSLVILDYHLPGISGLHVLEWIRQQPELGRMPVVMLSSHTDPGVINRAYTLGASAFLVKPTSFTALVELVSGLRNNWGSMSQGWQA